MKIYLTKNHTLFTLLPSQVWMIYFFWVLSYWVFFLAVFHVVILGFHSKSWTCNLFTPGGEYDMLPFIYHSRHHISVKSSSPASPWSCLFSVYVGEAATLPVCTVGVSGRLRLAIWAAEALKCTTALHFWANSKYFSPPPWTHLLPQSNTSHTTNDIYTHTSFPGFSPVSRRAASSFLHGTGCREVFFPRVAERMMQNLKTLLSYFTNFLFPGKKSLKLL